MGDTIETSLIVRAIAEGFGKLHGELNKTGTAGTAAEKGVGGLSERFKQFATVAAPVVGGLVAIGAGLNTAVNAAAEAEAVQAQLNQTLDNLGSKTDVTAAGVNNIASSLAAVTTAGDDTIVTGQNILIQMSNLSAAVLPRASEAMLDLATKTGSVESAAQFLGRALAEPEQAAARLEKQGIFLTQQQQEQIEVFTAAGDAAAAQGVVLDALSARYGGQARAAAQTYTGQVAQLKDATGELTEAIGQGLLPAATRTTTALRDMARAAIEPTSAWAALRVAVDEGALSWGEAALMFQEMNFTGKTAADVLEEVQEEMDKLTAANQGYVPATSQAVTVILLRLTSSER